MKWTSEKNNQKTFVLSNEKIFLNTHHFESKDCSNISQSLMTQFLVWETTASDKDRKREGKNQ